MNMRKEKLAEFIINKLETVSITDDELLLITLPSGLSGQQSNMIGQSIVDALRAIGKENPVLLLPEGMGLHVLNEQDMKELGWIRDAEFKQRNTDDNGDTRARESKKELTDKSNLRELWESVISNLAGRVEKGGDGSTVTYDDLQRRRPRPRGLHS